MTEAEAERIQRDEAKRERETAMRDRQAEKDRMRERHRDRLTVRKETERGGNETNRQKRDRERRQ